MIHYFARYCLGGSWWATELYAASWHAAEAMCRANGWTLDGEAVMAMDAPDVGMMTVPIEGV